MDGRIVRGEHSLDVGEKVNVELLSANTSNGFIDFEAKASAAHIRERAISLQGGRIAICIYRGPMAMKCMTDAAGAPELFRELISKLMAFDAA